MPIEITVTPSPTTPVLEVDAAGAVTCTVAYNTLSGDINNPGGVQHSVQVKNGTSFAGIPPGANGEVLTSDGTEWSSQPIPGAPSNLVTAAFSVDGNYVELTFSGNTVRIPRDSI